MFDPINLFPVAGPEGAGGVGGAGGPDRVDRKDAERIGRGDKTDGKSFADVLKDEINQVNNQLTEAEQAAGDLASGRTDDVEGVMNAVKKAELAFDAMMQIRNKLLDAYEEITRMRI